VAERVVFVISWWIEQQYLPEATAKLPSSMLEILSPFERVREVH
jgi:hypothetical protein